MWLCVAPVYVCIQLKRVPDLRAEAKLTLVFGLCSQESSDSSNTTVEDEDVKGKTKKMTIRAGCERQPFQLLHRQISQQTWERRRSTKLGDCCRYLTGLLTAYR